MRFKIGDPASYKYLEENGFVIFSDVASKEEQKELEGLFWDMITERNTLINPKDKSTWNNRNWIGRLDYGTIPTCGQSKFMWRSRFISKPVFIELYTYLSKNGQLGDIQVDSESKFISSFDGAGVMRDSSQIEWRGSKSWFHTDYDPIANPDVILYQGFLNLYDCDETTGGFYVIPGSHKHLISYMKKTNINHLDENNIFKNVGTPLKLNYKAGDFILWNHSTFHCNTYAPEPIFRDRIERVVAYVCMIPFNLVPKEKQETLSLKRLAVATRGCTTGHSPYVCEPYTFPDILPKYAHELV